MTAVPVSDTPNPEAHPPSWFDRLIAWFEGLPGPTWVAYGIAALLLIPLNHAARWIEESIPLGTLDPARIFEIPLFLFYLPMSSYLNTVAKKSMETFRPLLNVPASQVQQLLNDLTMLPRKTGWLTGILGIFIGSSSVLTSPSTWGLSASSSDSTVIVSVVIASVLMALVLSFLVRIVRMLRTVDRIQRMPERISLFQTDPVYAFSSLTSRAGISIVALIYYYFFLVYSLEIYGLNPPMSLIDYFGFGTLLLTGVAAFIIPLNGMHIRLEVEKTHRLSEVNTRIEKTIDRLHEAVDVEDSMSAESLNNVLTGLIVEEQTLSKISTWPWKPETLRGFLSAVILPIVIWLITTLLGRVVPG